MNLIRNKIKCTELWLENGNNKITFWSFWKPKEFGVYDNSPKSLELKNVKQNAYCFIEMQSLPFMLLKMKKKFRDR